MIGTALRRPPNAWMGISNQKRLPAPMVPPGKGHRLAVSLVLADASSVLAIASKRFVERIDLPWARLMAFGAPFISKDRPYRSHSNPTIRQCHLAKLKLQIHVDNPNFSVTVDRRVRPSFLGWGLRRATSIGRVGTYWAHLASGGRVDLCEIWAGAK